MLVPRLYRTAFLSSLIKLFFFSITRLFFFHTQLSLSLILLMMSVSCSCRLVPHTREKFRFFRPEFWILSVSLCLSLFLFLFSTRTGGTGTQTVHGFVVKQFDSLLASTITQSRQLFFYFFFFVSSFLHFLRFFIFFVFFSSFSFTVQQSWDMT